MNAPHIDRAVSYLLAGQPHKAMGVGGLLIASTEVTDIFNQAWTISIKLDVAIAFLCAHRKNLGCMPSHLYSADAYNALACAERTVQMGGINWVNVLRTV